MKLAVRTTVLVLSFIAAAPAHASTIDIRVLSASHTATVTTSQFSNTQTKSATDSLPVTANLYTEYIPDDLLAGFFGTAIADASADLMEVSTRGSASWTTEAIASADSEWTFSPLVGGMATIDILGTLGSVESRHSVSLFDMTANQQLWQFAMVACCELGLSETVSTMLAADHVYAMHLTAFAAARGDFTLSELSVSGLRVVSVPDRSGAFACLAIGLLLISGLKLRQNL